MDTCDYQKVNYAKAFLLTAYYIWQVLQPYPANTTRTMTKEVVQGLFEEVLSRHASHEGGAGMVGIDEVAEMYYSHDTYLKVSKLSSSIRAA